MRIQPLMNKKVNFSNTLQYNNSARPSFSAHLDEDLFERSKADLKEKKLIFELSKASKEKIEQRKRYFNEIGPLVRKSVDELVKINERFKDDPKLLESLYRLTDRVSWNALDDVPVVIYWPDRRKVMHDAFKSDPQILAKLYCEPMKNTHRIAAHYFNKKPEDLKLMCEAFKSHPYVLAKIFLTESGDRSLPAHFYEDLKPQEIMSNALKSQPEVLAKIYLSKNARGNLPAHYIRREVMHEALKSQPEVLAQIYMTKGWLKKTPAEVFEQYEFEQYGYDEKRKLVDQTKGLAAQQLELSRNFIEELAINSDLDIDTSIKLLEANNADSRYDELLEILKTQRNRENK